jgi:uncharacterized protein (TIGR03435 family)
MRLITVMASAGVVVTLAAVDVFSQSTPTFEVVSIRRNMAEGPVPGLPATTRLEERPDGGITFESVTVGQLIARAYPASGPRETANLPEWARRERYDVRATSSRGSATRDDRAAMLRAMLADRFKLTVHVETREFDAYDLVLAGSDRKPGPRLTAVDVPCPAGGAPPIEPAAGTPTTAPGPSDLKSPPRPCTFRIVDAPARDRGGDGQGHLGAVLEGDGTMAALAQILALPARRTVVDKTGLQGSYRVRMDFDFMSAIMGPAIAPTATAVSAPPLRDALEKQLGLKLESSRAPGETLVIDRLERPTEN